MKKIILSLLIGTGLLFANFTRDDSKETVFDESTSLMWQDDAIPVMMNWSVAKDYCENLTLGEHSDWHLPTKEELDSLIDLTDNDPTISNKFQNVKSYRYWSSTERTKGKAAWYVNFSYGHKDGYYKTDKNLVRCVRVEK